MKFKVGDKVKCLIDLSRVDAEKVGTVVVVSDDGESVGVDFKKDMRGHTIGGRISTQTGWWFGPESLRKVNMTMSNK